MENKKHYGQWVRKRDLAEILGVSTQAIDDFEQCGLLPLALNHQPKFKSSFHNNQPLYWDKDDINNYYMEKHGTILIF